MDPDTALENLRRDRKEYREWREVTGNPAAQEHALRIADDMADAIEALDDWLSSGGFKPKEWK